MYSTAHRCIAVQGEQTATHVAILDVHDVHYTKVASSGDRLFKR